MSPRRTLFLLEYVLDRTWICWCNRDSGDINVIEVYFSLKIHRVPKELRTCLEALFCREPRILLPVALTSLDCCLPACSKMIHHHLTFQPVEGRRREGRAQSLLLSVWLRSSNDYFYSPLTDQKLVMWPHLAVREAGKSSLYFGCHMPGSEPGDLFL